MFPLSLDGKDEFLHSVNQVFLTLLITERCNYKCAHCLYACSPAKSGIYMPDEVLNHVGRALGECHELTDDLPVLNILGGEPTIALPEFSRVVRWIGRIEASFRLSMVTNGWWLQNTRSLAKVALAMQPLWDMGEDYLRISISDTPWHDRFRTPHLQGILRHGNLADVLDHLEQWYPVAEVRPLEDAQRRAIDSMATVAKKEKFYIQHRLNASSNLIHMGRAEENGMGRRSHFCTARDLSLTIWPDGSIRHICDGAGKVRFGHIQQGLIKIWALRKEFLTRLHRRFPVPEDTMWSFSNARCANCRAYAGYWLDQEKPKF